MIGWHQPARRLADAGCAARVERHERHHQRDGGVAAKEAVALREHHPCAGARGAERSAEAGRTSPDDEHVGLAGEQRRPGWQREPSALRRSGEQGHQ